MKIDTKIKEFFEERGIRPANYFDALEVIRKEWMIDYKISASANNVLVEIACDEWHCYTASLEKAVEEAVKYLVGEVMEE